MKKKFIVFLASLLVIVLGTVNRAKADYGYKVTVSGGLYNDTYFVLENVPYGTRFTPSEYGLSVLEPNKTEEAQAKYYFKGYHISGEEVERDDAYVSSIVVTKDVTLVATYGIKGKTVAYTARFVDEQGKQLAQDAVYYGNIGDKAVVSYRYIDKYDPQAYNIRGTLKENANENVFTFTYKLRQGEVQSQSSREPGSPAGTGNASGKASTYGSGDAPVEVLDLDTPERLQETAAAAEAPVSAEPAPKADNGISWAAAGLSGIGGIGIVSLIWVLLKRR